MKLNDEELKNVDGGMNGIVAVAAQDFDCCVVNCPLKHDKPCPKGYSGLVIKEGNKTQFPCGQCMYEISFNQ